MFAIASRTLFKIIWPVCWLTFSGLQSIASFTVHQYHSGQLIPRFVLFFCSKAIKSIASPLGLTLESRFGTGRWKLNQNNVTTTMVASDHFIFLLFNNPIFKIALITYFTGSDKPSPESSPTVTLPRLSLVWNFVPRKNGKNVIKMVEEVNALRIFVVDAFTDKPFGGNPAAVCLVGSKVRKLFL